jgi:hypothetical protein
MKTNLLLLTAILAYSGTTVSAQTPIEIRTAGELAAIGKNENTLRGTYLLMNDLTLDNWTPTGDLDNTDGHGFSGTFDGNGHTITMTAFYDSTDYTKIGLFGSIDKRGVVKNLCVAGNIRYTGKQKVLYIGGIAGINYGLITSCASKIALEGNAGMIIGEKPSKKIQTLFGYEDGAYGGGIAGINLGSITNCYSAGSIVTYGRRIAAYAGGIAGGNGQPVRGNIGFSFGPGGGGISASPGKVSSYAIILHCYSTAWIFTNGALLAMSGGITGYNHPSGIITYSVALNKTVEANGQQSVATPVASIGGNTYFRTPGVYYRDDMLIREYKNRQDKKPDNFSPKNAVTLAATHDPSWWRYPDELTPKQRNRRFGFSFGEDEQSPWAWNDKQRLPVMHWETDTPEPPSASIASVLELPDMLQTQIQADSTTAKTSNISCTLENDTLLITGRGDIIGADLPDTSPVVSVIIDDSITGIGHHTFTMSKISSFILGASITRIGAYAFFNCNNLVRMELRSATPPKVGAFAFMSTPVKKAKLIVPAGTKAIYEKNKAWKKFGAIEERREE